MSWFQLALVSSFTADTIQGWPIVKQSVSFISHHLLSDVLKPARLNRPSVLRLVANSKSISECLVQVGYGNVAQLAIVA